MSLWQCDGIKVAAGGGGGGLSGWVSGTESVSVSAEESNEG